MAKEVSFSVPQRILGRSDVEFIVKDDGEVLGTLKVSKGSLVWFPKNTTKGHKIPWNRFDTLMQNHAPGIEYR
jgi:hypothetical protein